MSFPDNRMATGTPESLDPAIVPDHRLRLCALLEPVTDEQFDTVRRLSDMGDAALDEDIDALADARYLAYMRAGLTSRRQNSLYLTPYGRFAFHRQIAALRSIAASS